MAGIKRSALFFGALLLFVYLPGVAQEPKSKLAHANGDGTLKIGDEQFKIYSVIAKLMEDGKAEITLASEITVFLSGTWSRSSDSAKVIDLVITGAATGGGVDGKGKIYLRDDSSIDRFVLQGESRTTKKIIDAKFQAK